MNISSRRQAPRARAVANSAANAASPRRHTCTQAVVGIPGSAQIALTVSPSATRATICILSCVRLG
ncbi:MAG TPA: hypothetical protein VHW05_12035 [Phenylobacterium sp.]|nr:hypothetical protein [Phenylobacterium sp.]